MFARRKRTTAVLIAAGWFACVTAAIAFLIQYLMPSRTFVFDRAVDLGVVFPEGSPKVSATFRIDNPTSRVIRILNHQSTCECLDVSFSGRSIEPRGYITMTTTIQVPRGRASFPQLVTLQTDYLERPNWNCRVVMEVVPRVELDVRRLDFGTLDRANVVSRRQPVVAHYYRRSGEAPPDDLEAVTVGRALIEVSDFKRLADEPTDLAGVLRTPFHWSVAVKSSALEGAFLAGLTIRTKHPLASQSIPVSWTSESNADQLVPVPSNSLKGAVR